MNVTIAPVVLISLLLKTVAAFGDSAPPDFPTLMAVGENHACVQTLKDGLNCFGFNESLAVGAPNSYPRYARARIDNGFHLPVKSLALGSKHTCVLDRESKVFCWGSNSSYQLGVRNQDQTSLPQEVVGFDNTVVDLRASGARTCAVLVASPARACDFLRSALHCQMPM